MALKWPNKDKDEVLDYTVDWTDRLAGDIISTSVFYIDGGSPDDLIEMFDTNDDSTTTIWVSGGTDGITYSILNRITTTGGRTYDQTVKIKVKER